MESQSETMKRRLFHARFVYGIHAFGTSLFASCYLERQGDNLTVKLLLSGPVLSGQLSVSRNSLPIFTVNYCKFNSI